MPEGPQVLGGVVQACPVVASEGLHQWFVFYI